MKRIATIFILTLISIGASAQVISTGNYGFRLGLTTSPTIGWIKPERGKTEGLALGFSYGLMGDFNFAPNYSFSTALTITSMNGKSTEANVLPYYSGNVPQAYDLKYRLQYIDLPLTIKLKTIKVADTRWYGQFGLSNSFNISAKQDAKNGSLTVGDRQNITEYTRFYRAGLVLGAGGEFDLSGNTSLVAGLTFNNGFTSITNDQNRDVRNHYLALHLGVFF